MDELKLFDEDREQGVTPFVLLDGHGSRFALEFLEYINNDKHKWNVCLGVPYGTALWQIADSAQLHGMFKMLMTKAKRDLFTKRMASCIQDLQITKTDIVPLIRLCWELSFGNKKSTLKAICERGWGPYNRALLLKSVIRASMTEKMIESEKNSNLFPHKRLSHLHNIYYRENNKANIEICCVDEDDKGYDQINLNGGATSRYVTSTIVSDNDRQLARERIQKMKDEGKNLKERLAGIKKFMISTKMTIEAREYQLNQSIYEYVRDRLNEKDHQLGIQRKKEELEYVIKCYKADITRQRNPSSNIKDWSNSTDIKTYLDPLKKKYGDEAWPKSRAGMERLFNILIDRGRYHYVLDEDVMVKFDEWVRAEVNGEHKKKRNQNKKGK